jgi:hypothetical protein
MELGVKVGGVDRCHTWINPSPQKLYSTVSCPMWIMIVGVLVG